MPVVANCIECSDTHLLDDRQSGEEEQLICCCPECGSTQYKSEVDDSYEHTDKDAVRSTALRVSGVGEKTAQRVANKYQTLNQLSSAGIEGLADVSGVGEKTARRIQKQEIDG